MNAILYVNMVDVNSRTPRKPLPRPAAPAPVAEEELRQAIELLFYAYRDVTAEPDRLLAAFKFGRAHHRVLHFVGRNPGINVAELLVILRITKQSLARVLRDVMAHGFLVQNTDAVDRRRRRLFLTTDGVALEAKLSAPQQARWARAFADAGPDAVAGCRRVLLSLVNDTDRAALQRAQTARGRAANAEAPLRPIPRGPLLAR